MDAYVRGILMSQLFWSSHTQSMTFYTDVFLKSLAPGSRLLEIGPGHGLLWSAQSTSSAPGPSGAGFEARPDYLDVHYRHEGLTSAAAAYAGWVRHAVPASNRRQSSPREPSTRISYKSE